MDLHLNRTKPESMMAPQLCKDLNDMDDVCEDGAILYPIPHRMKAMESRFLKPQSEDSDLKQDSGIDSLSISLRSDSLYNSCDIRPKRTSQLSATTTTGDLTKLISPENDELFSRFDDLRVSERETIHPTQTTLCPSTRLPSLDDGFYSRSMSIPENDQTKLSTSVQRSYEESGPVSREYDEDEPILARLQEEIIQIYTQDIDGDTHLHLATIQMVPHVAIGMIDKAPSYEFLSLPNNLHQTPLHLAVITNQPSVVRRLMVGGACITSKDRGGNTPLHIACQEGYLDCIKCLTTPVITREMEINSYNELPTQRIPQNLNDHNYEGQTVLHIAVDSYLANPLKRTSLYVVIEHLLIIGANINAQDVKSGRTVLHYAADKSCLPLIELFLLHPTINVNAKTYSGKTAAHFAHARGFESIARLLLATGAEPIDLNRGESDSTESSSDEEMGDDSMYDDICIAGEPVVNR